MMQECGGAASPKSKAKVRQGRALAAWAMYEWAVTPFTTLLLTFVFPVYFSQLVVRNAVLGQTLWSYTAALAGVVVAVLMPVLGSIADAGGRNKPWLLASTAIFASASLLLWFVQPGKAFMDFAIAVMILGNVGFSSAIVFNNAMLPQLAPKDQTGRWSGWAWGLGYLGGLAALVLVLFSFLQNRFEWLPLDRGSAEHIRIVGPFVAFWTILFGWPRFVWTPDRPRSGLRAANAIKRGFLTLKATLRDLSKVPNVARFLLANMLYADALVAVFAVGGIYAAGAFKMSLTEVTGFAISLNVAAGAGAFGFAWVDDWLGPRKTILVALTGLMTSATGAVLVTDRLWFWVAGMGIGVFVGPAQAASRSLMSRFAPPGQEHEYFGLFGLSGKATAFVGPFLVAIVTSASDSQRLGLASLILLLVAGAATLVGVVEPQGS